VDSLSAENILRLDVSVGEPQVTETYPARIQVTLTKEDPLDRIRLYSGCPQFHEEDDWVSIPPGVLLSASDDPDHRTNAGPRWVLDPPPESAGGDPGCGGDIDFRDGPFQVEYELYDDGRESGYLDPGFYMFSHDFTWIPVESLGDDSVDRVLFMLEFGLTIEN
jgi:hypothetical protein